MSVRPWRRKRRRSVTPCGSAGRRGVERPRRRRLPVDDDHAVVVLDPAAADVERILDGVDVDAAEAQHLLRPFVGGEPAVDPGLDLSGGDVRAFGADPRGTHRAQQRLAHAAPGTRTRGRGTPARREDRDAPSALAPSSRRRSPTRGTRARGGGTCACSARAAPGCRRRQGRPGSPRATPRPRASAASRSDPSRPPTTR